MNLPSSLHWSAALGAIAVAGAGTVAAETCDQGPVFSWLEENDLIVNTDRHYTQGIKLAYLQRDDELPCWARAVSDWIPAKGFDRRTVKFGYEIGQNIYTPENTAAGAPLPDDPDASGLALHGLHLAASRPHPDASGLAHAGELSA